MLPEWKQEDSDLAHNKGAAEALFWFASLNRL